MLKSSDSDSSSRVDKNWTDRFMKRNPQFFLQKNTSLTAKRKNAHNVKNMSKFYEQYNKSMNLFGCKSHDTWNMNESDFRVDCETSHWVMILDSKQKMIITDSDNRDYITIAECINEADDSISSFLILKKINILIK
jgi:hypothetical protein